MQIVNGFRDITIIAKKYSTLKWFLKLSYIHIMIKLIMLKKQKINVFDSISTEERNCFQFTIY